MAYHSLTGKYTSDRNNRNNLIHRVLQSNAVDLSYLKLWILLDQISLNIKGSLHQVAKILELENFSL